jgi:hypothetical protein
MDEPTKQQDGELEASPTEAPTESSETLREAFMKAISGSPQFREASKSGKAFVIVGNR